MKVKYDKKVRWEFNARLVGYGQNVQEAMYDACLLKQIDIMNPRNKSLLRLIEENEVFMIDSTDIKDFEPKFIEIIISSNNEMENKYQALIPGDQVENALTHLVKTLEVFRAPDPSVPALRDKIIPHKDTPPDMVDR